MFYFWKITCHSPSIYWPSSDEIVYLTNADYLLSLLQFLSCVCISGLHLAFQSPQQRIKGVKLKDITNLICEVELRYLNQDVLTMFALSNPLVR